MKYPVKEPLLNINTKHNISDGLYYYMKQEIERLNKIIKYLLDNSDEASNVYEEYKRKYKE